MKYNKLVRDNIPEILDKKGIGYEMRVANDSEYLIELIKKLKEEVDEFIEDKSVEELSDVVEVLNYIKDQKEYSNLEEVRFKKREEKGGFDKRYIVKGEK